MDLQSLLPIAIQAAEKASAEILKVYQSGNFQTTAKGDQSPLTQADRAAHLAIESVLKNTGIPILSEEGKLIPYTERKTWEYLWLVDPLDGTKEFIKQNGEFTVNIALVHKGMPVLGVVSVPVAGTVYYAALGNPGYLKRKEQTIQLAVRDQIDLSKPGLRVVASRTHMNEETRSFIEKLQEPILVSRGSSLKFMMLVEGEADIYPRYAPTMEWDTAAAQVVANSVGIKVYQVDRTSELSYNKENLLNPHFLCY
jgi:3'(2'), 5'-bisphosphate nucleotidase